MDIAAAATRLGVPEREVVDVADHDHGTVITTTDGVAYIDVADDTPDADGKVGLMFLALPRPGMLTSFPVFATEEPAPADAVVEADEHLAEGTVAEVKDRVGSDSELAKAALDAELAKGDKARSSLVDHLQHVASLSEDADVDLGGTDDGDDDDA